MLVTGTSKAQTVSPLGNKYFMDTGSECKDSAGNSQARYAFVNNIPEGKIPIISSAMGTEFKDFRGLVPGILEDLGNMNPSAMFNAFQDESPCQKITLVTRDSNNKMGQESRYVSQSDAEAYSPCWFPDKRNPVTKLRCQEGMQSQFPNDPIVKMYLVGLGALGGYMLYRFTRR